MHLRGVEALILARLLQPFLRLFQMHLRGVEASWRLTVAKWSKRFQMHLRGVEACHRAETHRWRPPFQMHLRGVEAVIHIGRVTVDGRSRCTYEGLKHGLRDIVTHHPLCSRCTYEGLKLLARDAVGPDRGVPDAPTRG